MIQSKVIEYVNVKGVNIEKPFSNGSETTSWWKKFIQYVENNENKMKSHPYWNTIATNGPISYELAFDEDENYVLFDPLPYTEINDSDEVVVLDYEPLVQTVTYEQFKSQGTKRLREDENFEEHRPKKLQAITTKCRYTSFCTNEYCVFLHPENITPGPHNRKCMYGSHCNKLNSGCKFNHETR